MRVGEHPRVVNARERQVSRVFQQARGSDGNRVARHREVRAEPLDHVGRQRGRLEPARDSGVVLAAERQLREALVLQEAVEHLGAEHDGRRNGDPNARKCRLEIVLGNEQIDQRQPASLAAQRTGADPAEAPRRIE
jgi:hypothetical protein